MVDIKQGDCLELMKEIPDGSIDMVLCDLPYGTTSNEWDNVIPFEPLFAQYDRIVKRGGGDSFILPTSIRCGLNQRLPQVV